ncbi:hypothetical protein FSP39_006633 [Pinctada imbricata]|uniref:Uncharacterized protein n=1 Tax=Pinctada imbricata TaxID=66713 RepID=A0AA88Y2L8_PINIB|nr:hypothetical protein FSP39_006633 [Pinctada imbricata]
MSLNPALGHLYHDSSFGDIAIRLDAHEQLRTRQRNRREDRQLGKYSQTLERAKTICERRYQWEENEVRHQLQSIQSRTPTLEKGLQKESERLNRYQESISERRLQLLSRASTGSKTISRVTTAKTVDSNATSIGKLSNNSSQWNSKNVLSRNFHLPSDVSSRSNTARTFSEEEDLNIPKSQVNFIKKAENIAKCLHKLYRRKRERKYANRHLMEYVRSDNKELLMKARVFYKDTEAVQVLEKILTAKGEGDLDQNEVPTTAISDNNSGSSEKQNRTEDQPKKRVYINELIMNRNIPVNEELSQSSEEEVAEVATAVAAEIPDNPLVLQNSNQPMEIKDSPIVSSVLVNPSVSSFEMYDNPPPRKVKWSDNLGGPELWKLYYEKQKLANMKEERKKSLVTITARYRRTLVR